jgi:hypothetical protein
VSAPAQLRPPSRASSCCCCCCRASSHATALSLICRRQPAHHSGVCWRHTPRHRLPRQGPGVNPYKRRGESCPRGPVHVCTHHALSALLLRNLLRTPCLCCVMPPSVCLLQLGTHESFQVIVDDRNVGFASLTAPDSCIRELSTVRGGLVRGRRWDAGRAAVEEHTTRVCLQQVVDSFHVAAYHTSHPVPLLCCMQVIYDDGNIPNLSALANIRAVNGPLIIWGNGNASLQSLAGLEGIRVSGWCRRQDEASSQLHSRCVLCWVAWAGLAARPASCRQP